ncbi:MAG: glycosyltransferase [Gemmatimonadota bacterium]|nr:glycosyltransferase [Gemmatimonadota bacterium]MDZ4865566.1 glycosyltransferase [Gemmatimonadota bacterium]
MTQVIVIAYHFPPSTAVGGLRSYKVARALWAAGYDVHVIAATPSGQQSGTREILPGLVVELVKPWTSPRWWYVNLKRRIFPGRPEPAESTAGGPVSIAGPVRPVARLKRWISALLWLPDDKQGFIPVAVIAGLRARRAGGKVLYTSAPPFSTHLAGLALHFVTGLPWVIEFRDPWTDSHFRSATQRSRWTSIIERWLERQCLRRSALVVSVTEGIHRLLASKLPASASPKFMVTRNGIPALRAPSARPGIRRPPRVVYVGSFYHARDPFPFLESLAAFLASRELNATRLQVDLIGDCRTFNGWSVAERAARLGLSDVVRIWDWVPHAEAQAAIDSASLLLLLAQDQPAQVPNKLYDYLGSRIPILAYVDQEGESAWMLREVGGHFLVTQSAASGAEDALASILGLSAIPHLPPDDRLESWTTDRQMAGLVDAVATRSGVLPAHPARSASAPPTG